MNNHIVRVNDKIDKIALLYNLNKDEIIKINTHIRDWDHLIPGTKIKLPIISEELKNELDNTEPFIEDYYPKIDPNNYLNNHNATKEVILNETEQVKDNITESKTKKTSSKPTYYNGYNNYGYYNNIYNPYSSRYYNNFKKRNKTKK